jgi:hypothetical protein
VVAVSTGGVERWRWDNSGATTTGAQSVGSLTVNSDNISAVNSLGFRNRIINGGMDIWQRGTSTTTTGNTYLADRWVSAFSTGGTVSQETSSLPTGSRYAWKFTSSASNSFLQMGQQIEYANCYDLQNLTVSISFQARSLNSNAGSTALTVRTRTAAGVDATCIFSGTSSDTAVTLTTAWTKYTVTRTLPTTFGALSLEFLLGANVSGDGFILDQIQLEPGSVATPFERVDYGRQLILCQRYFEKSFTVDTTPANGVYSMSYLGYVCYADQWVFAAPTILFKTTKRVVPTVAFYGTSTNTWQINDNSNNWINYAAVGVGFQASIGIYTTGFSAGVHNNGNSGYAIGSARMIRGDWTASSEF